MWKSLFVDRRFARLIFGGTLALMSLLYYCCGGSHDTVLDDAAQQKLVQQAKDIAGDEQQAVKMLDDGH